MNWLVASVGSVLLVVDAPIETQTSSTTPVLIFEFPDGARGGNGKIQGTSTDQMPFNFTLTVIRNCGASNARKSDVQMSHRSRIVSDSTAGDRDLVACVKRSIPFHFTAFLSDGDPFSGKRDDTPFRDFWTSPEKPKKNEAQ